MKIIEMEWMPADSIKLLPQWHSDAMNIKRLLIVLSDLSNPQVGWYYGGLMQQWRMEGSPSVQHPTHWMPMPPMP